MFCHNLVRIGEVPDANHQAEAGWRTKGRALFKKKKAKLSKNSRSINLKNTKYRWKSYKKSTNKSKVQMTWGSANTINTHKGSLKGLNKTQIQKKGGKSHNGSNGEATCDAWGKNNLNKTGNHVNTQNHDVISVKEEKIITENMTVKDVCNISALKETQNFFLLRSPPQIAR